jgi:signal transduction histidine kinase
MLRAMRQTTATDTVLLRTQREPRQPLPLRGLPALLVSGLALASALVLGLLGTQHLRAQSDRDVMLRTQLLAIAAASVLDSEARDATSTTKPPSTNADLVRAAAVHVDALVHGARGTEALLTDANGTVLVNAALQSFDGAGIRNYLATTRGITETGVGRAYFEVAPVHRTSWRLIVFCAAPASPDEVAPFIGSITALTLLLVVLAGTTAYGFGSDATRDIAHVHARVAQMTEVASEPAGEDIAPRGLDAVGALTVAFNGLRSRFLRASQEHNDNLQRAQGQDQDRAAFLAAVSHELRTPLNSVLGFADVLLSEVDGPLTESQREDIQQVREGGARLIELINDILEFSALEGGQLKLKLGPVDLHVVAESVVREAAMLVGHKAVALSLSVKHAVTAQADERRVRQILWNLIGNAIKFTQQGSVVVTVSRENNAAVLQIADTGPGISADDRALIFEEYVQAKGERARKRGTGLGLAITRRLARLHGGGVELESEVGAGAKFTVRLPLAPFRAHTGTEGRASSSTVSVAGNMR